MSEEPERITYTIERLGPTGWVKIGTTTCPEEWTRLMCKPNEPPVVAYQISRNGVIHSTVMLRA